MSPLSIGFSYCESLAVSTLMRIILNLCLTRRREEGHQSEMFTRRRGGAEKKNSLRFAPSRESIAGPRRRVSRYAMKRGDYRGTSASPRLRVNKIFFASDLRIELFRQQPATQRAREVGGIGGEDVERIDLGDQGVERQGARDGGCFQRLPEQGLQADRGLVP